MKKVAIILWVWALSASIALAQESGTGGTVEPASGSTVEKGSGEEKQKEAKFGAVPYIFSGPDTGFGLGASGLFRDLLNKEGRDFTFSASYTTNQYLGFSINWSEPKLFSENGWANLYVNYNNKPNRRFYGIGNDSDKDAVSSFGETDYKIEPRYDYWFLTGERRLGVKISYKFASFDPKDGSFDWSEAMEDLEDKSLRPISVMHPRIYESEEFENGGITTGPGILLVYDDRKDKFPIGGGRDECVFPIGGGRQELFFGYYDEALGSDFNYKEYRVNLTYNIPLGWDWTILALRAQAQIKEGDVPFWDMSSFGSDSTIRGYHDGRYRGNHSTLFNAELRQAFDVEFSPVPWGALKQFVLRAPMVVLFYDYGRVFMDEDKILEETDGYHYTYGVGFRFIISPSVLVRFDWGISEEEMDSYITASWPF